MKSESQKVGRRVRRNRQRLRHALAWARCADERAMYPLMIVGAPAGQRVCARSAERDTRDRDEAWKHVGRFAGRLFAAMEERAAMVEAAEAEMRRAAAEHEASPAGKLAAALRRMWAQMGPVSVPLRGAGVR